MSKLSRDAELEAKARELMSHMERLADRVYLQQDAAEVGRREAIVLKQLIAAPLTMGELSGKLGLALSTVTGIIDRLVERELVTRDRSEDDRRIVVVKLTPRGRKMSEKCQAGKIALGTAFLSALEPDEREALIEMFRKIAREHGDG